MLRKLRMTHTSFTECRISTGSFGSLLTHLVCSFSPLQVFSMLLRKTRSVNLLIPNLPKHAVDQETYEGATVIEPKKAFYEEPIATLDFASLYPSIMQVPQEMRLVSIQLLLRPFPDVEER